MKKTNYIYTILELKKSVSELKNKDLLKDDIKLEISGLFREAERAISSIEEKELCTWLFNQANDFDYGSVYFTDIQKYENHLNQSIKTLDSILPD
jgi:hypothetical protein